ncbi:DNA polymerase [Human adenovirus 7] [Rhizoctonia solani]|uniref:DNA polymerase [Human adenovirus 7] n=1 Tax=Rhizoctonia solani TaxID=456999 RepID=A0A0K6FME0_9AGAM|nr:DNA polymerase [Human adenovirus 7] [Rhizoctonia solani]
MPPMLNTSISPDNNGALNKTTLSERIAHNRKRAVNKLPDELYEEIFLIVEEPARFARKQNESLMKRSKHRYTPVQDIVVQVSSRWRQAAIASPALWSHIYISDIRSRDITNLWVSRAGREALLDIDIELLQPYCGSVPCDVADRETQKEHATSTFKYLSRCGAGPQRWRSLSLFVLYPELLYEWMGSLNQQPAPELRYLQLSVDGTTGDIDCPESKGWTKAHALEDDSLSSCAMPHLLHAKLERVPWRYVFDRPRALFSGLSTLKLFGVFEFPNSLLKLHRVLSANPGLTHLELEMERAPPYVFNRFLGRQHIRPVHLPSLQKLSLTFDDAITKALEVISIIEAPSLESLTLNGCDLSARGVASARLFECISAGNFPANDPNNDPTNNPLFPSLRELDIGRFVVVFDGFNVTSLITCFPMVSRLCIPCSAATQVFGGSQCAVPYLEDLSLLCRWNEPHRPLLDKSIPTDNPCTRDKRVLLPTVIAIVLNMPSNHNLLETSIMDNTALSLSERKDHNNKQVISKLPDELLTHIFLVATGLSIRARGAYRFTLFPDVAIQVCSQWMRVALASPTLWTHIHIREHFDDDDVALWISRAGSNTLLDIEIDILEPYCGVAFFDITDWAEQTSHIARIFKFLCSIKAGPRRWRSLSLSVLQPEPLYKFIQLLNKQPAPNLRHLYLCSEPDWNDDEFDEDRPLTKAHYGKAYSLSEHAVPNLRHAEFIYVSWKYVFDRSKSLLCGLTALELSAGRDNLASLAQIQQLLSANPQLRSLHISAGFAGDYEFDRLPNSQRPKYAHLTSLKALSLEGGDNISLVWDILSIINAPSLESLVLSNNGIDEDDIFATNILDYISTGKFPESKNLDDTTTNKPLFPLLRMLDIEGLVSLDAQKTVQLLSSLPQITRLSMSCYQVEKSLGGASSVLPHLEVLSSKCLGSHQHYQSAEAFLARRASDGMPIPILEVPASPQPEPGFEDRFPGSKLRIMKD